MKKAVDTGRIHLVDGKIDPAQADLEWAKNTLAPTNGNGVPHPPAPPPPPDRPPEQFFDLNTERARNEHYKAERERLALEREEGKTLDAEEARREIFAAVRSLRDRARTIPDRLSSPLASETEPAVIARLLLAELDRIFEKLNADLSKNPR